MLSKIKSQIRKFKYKLRFNSKFQCRENDEKFYHVNNLRSEGFSIDKSFLKKSNIAQKIIECYEKIPEEEINQIISSNNNKEFVRDGAEDTNIKSFKKKITNYFNEDDLYEFANQNVLLSEIEQYFGFAPKLRYISVWVDFPITYNTPTWSQLFHRDNDDYHLVKVFFYLNHVSEQNGPFQFLNKTHYDSWENFSPNKLSLFQKKNLKSAIGEKGMLILCDTNGYHRGLTPAAGHRAMLTVNYVSNNPKPGFLKNIID